MKRETLAVLAVGLLLSARGAVLKSEYRLTDLRPLDISETASPSSWSVSNAATLYPVANGFSAGGRPADMPVARDTLGAVAYRLEHSSVGMTVSEQQADFSIGDRCSNLPTSDPGEIDWAATKSNILASADYAAGYVYFDESSTDAYSRVIFTRGGPVSVTWALTNGVQEVRAYTIATSASERPYRIFWTEAPFNAPKINLKDKFVRLLGDPAIVNPVYSVSVVSRDPYNAVSNIVRGVVFDPSANVLRAYCRVINEATGEFDGPQGQFVLAYYDTGAKDRLIATVVVEVSGPDVIVQSNYVGDELRPQGGGYSVTNLQPYIQKGVDSVIGDKFSPYLYQYSAQSYANAKNNAVFAITPTDQTVSGTEATVEWKADIYWRIPDCMDTLWPFEEDQYVISWNPYCPVIITGGSTNPGAGLQIPSGYAATLCTYESPAACATLPTGSNTVTVTSAGHFMLKLTKDDDIWFVPFESILHDDTAYFTLESSEVYVGQEIELRGGSLSGLQPDYVNDADVTLPGYIYEPSSPGRNWNPRLYHTPTMTNTTVSTATTTDPYAALASAIYPVNASTNDIEVWWYRSYQQKDMPMALRFPTIVQRYHAAWPDPGDAHELVIASQLGSACNSLVTSGHSLYLQNADSEGLSSWFLAGTSEGSTLGFWLNLSPRAGGSEPAGAGHLFSIRNAAGASVDVSAADGCQIVLSVLDSNAVAKTVATLSLASNTWNHVALEAVPTNSAFATALYLNGSPVATAAEVGFPASLIRSETWLTVGALSNRLSATGTALDSLAVWGKPLSADEVREVMSAGCEAASTADRLQMYYGFDGSDDLAPVALIDIRSARDSAIGGTLGTYDIFSMEPGAPQVASGTLAEFGGVAPEIYYSNTTRAATIGYNPNEEHAFLRLNGSDYVVWALRCDLNAYGASEPYVLAQYNSAGKSAMRLYHVVLTNDLYPVLGSAVTAGSLLLGPHPLDYLAGYYNSRNFCVESDTNDDAEVVYRDRQSRMWARRDGTTTQYNYYPLQDGFWFPSLDAAKQPAAGSLVGWLSCLDIAKPTFGQVLNARPIGWPWTASWPADDKIPAMKVAQTLTTADSGLPEVWNASSMAVVYPAPRATDSNGQLTNSVVQLIDPVVAQTASLAIASDFPKEYGFTTGSSGTCFTRKGFYYFTGLPPAISDRFYIDPNASVSNRMALIGKLVTPTTGSAYLQMNVLSVEERAALKAICTTTDSSAKSRWNAAVDSLAKAVIQPTAVTTVTTNISYALGNGAQKAVTEPRVTATYSARENYALVATGRGAGYVTLIENDSPDTSMVASGSPVSMHILKVKPELYAGPLVVLEDANNKLSEQLNVNYTAPLGSEGTNYVFEWRSRTPPSDGVVPTNYLAYGFYTNGNGLVDLLLGGSGATLKELVNTYFAMRYKPRPGTAAYALLGDTWSGWCGPTLAEGWVQRVLKNVTPFAQRLSDFYANATELSLTMPEQIGKPYNGDVALNNDNLENVGLIQLYQTVLNKAESLSLTLGINDSAANKQLMEAASRLADLEMLLGAEAYSDAKNPTIGVGSASATKIDYESLPSSVFCFANQESSLLDEELALLRGRTAAVAPNLTTFPCYNRLMWNFTTGVTEGEMAYALNYNIMGDGGEITAAQAASQYPQGHGDAWGYYLSAISGFYRLLRNPYFSWGDPGMMEMLVADSIVNMDYEEEQKFADAAAKLAQIGADVVDLTARKSWRDSAGAVGGGYLDSNSEQGFGYGEWGIRTGLGVIYNWAMVNSLLPEAASNGVTYFSDKSIKDVDRTTVPALAYLGQAFTTVEQKVSSVDAGLNPLGLSDNAIPFDIDPSQLDQHNSHFEQILTRSERALTNAANVLAYAQKYGSRIRAIEDTEGDLATEYETVEASYNKQLIEYYGYPYAGDIGAGGTYPQGYDGPDLYHYMWMDLAPYGLSSLENDQSKTITIYKTASDNYYSVDYAVASNQAIAVTYTISSGGIIVKPASVTGVRRAEGKIQAAYRDFLQSYLALRQAAGTYDSKVSFLTGSEKEILNVLMKDADIVMYTEMSRELSKEFCSITKLGSTLVINAAELVNSTVKMAADAAYQGSPKIIGAGLTVNVDPSAIAGAIGGVAKTGTEAMTAGTITGAKYAEAAAEFALASIENILDSVENGAAYDSTVIALNDRLRADILAIKTAAADLQNAYAAIAAAEQTYRSLVAEGDRIQDEREMVRKQQSNNTTALRYSDMYYRVQRNSALSMYTASFDVAQKYVYLLAKVYDYETGLLSSDSRAADSFLRQIVATRALGQPGVSIVPSCSDGGLYDIVNRLSENWAVLKGRLGVNNPYTQTKWFSLRYSLFRIDSGDTGEAAWRQELKKYWVDDILANSEFVRYFQPASTEDGSRAKTPGLIIPFSTCISQGRNFFGKSLGGGEETFSSTRSCTKVRDIGVQFVGYDTNSMTIAPNIFLAPIGHDKMYAYTSSGTASRPVFAFRVVDQVLPLPYPINRDADLSDSSWFAMFNGTDGEVDSVVSIRRFPAFAEGSAIDDSRLVGRSVWNDRWLLVIPADAIGGDLDRFVSGGVSDIRLGIRAYAGE